MYSSLVQHGAALLDYLVAYWHNSMKKRGTQGTTQDFPNRSMLVRCVHVLLATPNRTDSFRREVFTYICI
jgi:hypothetical protein